MPLSGVRLDAITESHLQGLIDNSVSEGRRIDYKNAVGGSGDDKREFLADVSSFANAAGGDLLVGVDETGGVASALVGVAKKNTEAEILRLENLIRDGLDPRIQGLAIQAVDLTDPAKVVLVVRIPRSWAAPHMVTFRGHSRFYSRNSAGKYPLDVAEIRAAFVGSESGRAQLRSFRSERLGRILADDGPILLEPNPKTVLHLIPLSALEGARHDVTGLAENYNNPNFWPLVGRAMSQRINYDGVLSWAPWGRDEPAMAYTQVFRNGAIEGVESYMLKKVEGPHGDAIPSIDFERSLIEGLKRYFGLAQQIGAPPPYVVALSMLGVRGMWMAVSERFFSDERTKIDRDDLVIPETLVEDASVAEAHTVLKPLFDTVWNAVGWPASPYYTDAGEWKPDR